MQHDPQTDFFARLGCTFARCLRWGPVAFTMLAAGFCPWVSGCSSSGAPFIGAALTVFTANEAPAGFQNAAVTVLDGATGRAVSDATVSINGVLLPYVSANQDYEGNVDVAPGGAVKLNVQSGGHTYSATATEFATYPEFTAPDAGASWGAICTNAVTWSAGAPLDGASYALAVLDAAGTTVWPGPGGPAQFPNTQNSYSLVAGTLQPGGAALVIGIISQSSISGAAASSELVVGGFTGIPITVVSGAAPVSLSVQQFAAPLPILRGNTEQFGALEMFCDGTSQQVADAMWTSSNTDVATISNDTGSNGLATGVDAGTTTITATAGDFSASTTLSVQGTMQDAGTTNGLAAVVWTGAQYVTVGNQGTVLTSPDGVTWTPRNSGTTNDLQGLVWSGTQLVAVGLQGTILTSPDGVTWTNRSLSAAVLPTFKAVTWSGTRFVAVGSSFFQNSPTGYGGAVFTSPDAGTWTNQTPDAWVGESLFAVASSGTKFLAVGQPDNSGTNVFTSADGVAWVGQTVPAGATTSSVYSVVWSGTQFVAGDDSGLFSSPDGLSWSSANPPGTVYGGIIWEGMAWTGTQYVAAGAQGFVVTSPDGVTWTQWVKAPLPVSNLSGVAGVGDEFVLVGSPGTILTSF